MPGVQRGVATVVPVGGSGRSRVVHCGSGGLRIRRGPVRVHVVPGRDGGQHEWGRCHCFPHAKPQPRSVLDCHPLPDGHCVGHPCSQPRCSELVLLWVLRRGLLQLPSHVILECGNGQWAGAWQHRRDHQLVRCPCPRLASPAGVQPLPRCGVWYVCARVCGLFGFRFSGNPSGEMLYSFYLPSTVTSAVFTVNLCLPDTTFDTYIW